MKIGTITFSFSNNVGSALQTFALQQKIKFMFGESVDCRVLNYEKKDWLGHYSIDTAIRHPKNFVIFLLVKFRISICFWHFQSKYIKFDRIRRYSSQKILYQTNNKFDCFIAGSDQIWNTEISKVDSSYFLSFVQDVKKKIAYAPSFGNTNILNEDNADTIKYIKRFDCISVRDSQSKEILRQIAGLDVMIILDPTLLLSGDYWNQFAKKRMIQDDYVLLYIRDRNIGIAEDFARDYAKQKKLKLVPLFGINLNHSPFTIIGPREWLSLIINAECVITNSFHACAFSINLHKRFYADANQNSGRILDLLKNTNLEGRLINCGTMDDINKSIDFSHADKYLEINRKISTDYLYKSLIQ